MPSGEKSVVWPTTLQVVSDWACKAQCGLDCRLHLKLLKLWNFPEDKLQLASWASLLYSSLTFCLPLSVSDNGFYQDRFFPLSSFISLFFLSKDFAVLFVPSAFYVQCLCAFLIVFCRGFGEHSGPAAAATAAAAAIGCEQWATPGDAPQQWCGSARCTCQWKRETSKL